MKYRLSKIYTRKGDEGYTSFQGKRISKDDLLLDVAGAIDELNSHIGFALSLISKDEKIIAAFTQIQQELFNLGGELHTPECTLITADHVKNLETWLDSWNSALPPLTEFILPQGNSAAVACHIARTVCRRAERVLVALHRRVPLSNMELLRYLNRLSDFLFVIARILAKDSTEILWHNSAK